eukprot:109819-Rhodomonas_salina.1
MPKRSFTYPGLCRIWGASRHATRPSRVGESGGRPVPEPRLSVRRQYQLSLGNHRAEYAQAGSMIPQAYRPGTRYRDPVVLCAPGTQTRSISRESGARTPA